MRAVANQAWFGRPLPFSGPPRWAFPCQEFSFQPILPGRARRAAIAKKSQRLLAPTGGQGGVQLDQFVKLALLMAAAQPNQQRA